MAAHRIGEDRTMKKLISISSVLFGVLTLGSAALASPAQEEMTPPASVFMYDVVYSSVGSTGQYTESGTYYNDAPVYTRAGTGYTWSLYKRANGNWYVDFNDVSEDWSGTVTYTEGAADYPWNATWQNGEVAFRTQKVHVYGVPYASLGSNGDYTVSGETYSGAPVYTRTDASTGSTWSLYKRANGSWYVDFNDVSEDWDGTIAYTNQAMDWPWSADDWNNTSYRIFDTKSVQVHQIPGEAQGSVGEYNFTGQFYNSEPVFKKPGANGVTFSLYKRADGKWYVDNNAISEAADGTLISTTAAAEWPWTATWNGSAVVFRESNVVASDAPYSSIGSAGTYSFTGQIYNNAPVYARTGGGYTWSLYKRSTGKWHIDFNTVSEDWDGTVAYTSNTASYAWSATWQNGELLASPFDL